MKILATSSPSPGRAGVSGTGMLYFEVLGETTSRAEYEEALSSLSEIASILKSKFGSQISTEISNQRGYLYVNFYNNALCGKFQDALGGSYYNVKAVVSISTVERAAQTAVQATPKCTR